MLILIAYHRAKLAEIEITPGAFAADPIGAVERASATPSFDAWAWRRLASATALRSIFDDVWPNPGGSAFGIQGHRVFARTLRVLGVTG